jgi:hypothetical protein
MKARLAVGMVWTLRTHGMRQLHMSDDGTYLWAGDEGENESVQRGVTDDM